MPFRWDTLRGRMICIGMVVMRFLKVFLLLGLFGLGVIAVKETAAHYRKQALLLPFKSNEEARIMVRRLRDGDLKVDEWRELSSDLERKMVPALKVVNRAELAGFLTLVLIATLAYLRMNPRRT